MKKSIVILTALTLSACATMTTGKTQDIKLISTPSGASCTASNEKGSWSATTPQTVTVMRSKQALTVTCKKGGMKGSRKVESTDHPQNAMNVFVGGTVGAIVDQESGAAWQYLPEIHIDLK